MRLYIKAILILASLVTVSRACDIGCIRCNQETQECLACDFRNDYVPAENGGCEVSTITDCVKLNYNGDCILCAPGTYYDQATNDCVTVTDSFDNCRAYSGPSSCSLCNNNHYLDLEGNCILVDAGFHVRHCTAYNSEEKCTECRRGFVPNAAGDTCVKVNVNVCHNYNNYFCNKCDAASIANSNAYLLKPFDDGNETAIKNVLNRLVDSNINTFVSSICMPTSVTNCKIFRAHNKCFMCEDGHFLTENEQCQAYTVNDLNGCQDFTSETECLKCSNGHYLDGTTCAISTIVENCDLYSESVDACVQCTADYYLFEGACVARVNGAIGFCASYTVDADTCESCEATHQIDDAGLECVELPENCKDYILDDADNVICAVCVSGHYVNGDGLCVAGTVENCDVYTVNADTCESCLEGFSLGENVCVAHDISVENCETYLIQLPTRCDTCNSDSVKYHQTSVCQPNAEISFCASFLNISTCEACEEGYQLVDNGCVEIPAEENCLEKAVDSCVRCLSDYEIIDGACVLIPPYYSENCAIVNPETVGETFECLGCATDYIPITDVQNICVEAAEQSFTLIDNCEKYVENNDVYECKLCSIGFALSSDRTACVESCLETEVMYLGVLNKLVTNIADVTAFAQCVDLESLTDIPTGCAVASHNIKGENNVCLKCAEGYIPIDACTLDNTFFNIDDFTVMEEGQAFPVVSCALDEGAVFFPNSVGPEANCQHYLAIESNYYCNQCVFGITGRVLIDNGNHYLECTETIAGGNPNVKVGSGFTDDAWIADMYGFNLAYKYTCHKCADANQIPFIHLNDKNGLEAYQLNNTDDVPSEAAEHDGRMTVCREPTEAGLFFAEGTFNGFVDNCALGLIVVDLAKSDDIANNPSVRCLACKDGFKRTFDASGFYIASCDQIENCAFVENDEWFDGCKNCAEGSTKALNVNGEVDANNCTATTNIANCRVYDDENSNCAYCERGYYKDHDGQCVNIGIPHCSGFAQRAELSFKLTGDVNNYSYVYYFGASGFDCYSCDVGYVALGVELSNPICVSHPNLATQSAEAGSNYIANCERYYLDINDNLLCRQCGTGFVINADYTTCFEETVSLANCKVCDLTGNACEDCLEGYLLDAGQCFEANIANCASHEINAAGNGVNCVSCDLGHVLENNSCISGTINNCGVYIDADTCESCQEGHFLVVNECFAIPSHTNCLEATITNDVEPNYHCDVCEFGYTLDETITSTNYPICVKAPIIEGCVSYNADFECQACDENYYFNTGVCIQRANTDVNCLVYKSDVDECERCISDYVLNENQECAEVLHNVDFCVRYTSEVDCDLCATGRYLLNNECLIVPELNLIDNCEFYSSDTECSHCLNGFVLIDNQCLEQVALNCESYRSPNICQSCLEGYHFQRRSENVDLVIDCVEGQILNCADYNLFSGACSACDPHFVLNVDTCVEVTPQIANCKVYKTETECEVCDKGYIRSSSGSSCTLIDEIQQFEPNCIDLRYGDEPRCTACRPGTYFNSGKCVQCSANTIADGCKFCNPIDNTVCLVCRAGYYMNDLGTCTVDDSAVNGDEAP